MRDIRTTIERAAGDATNRHALWSRIVAGLASSTMVAEVGVWRGEFAEHLLRNCPAIQTYYMLDAWRHLPQWNKPFNVSNVQFDAVLAEALSRTQFAADRR